MYNQGDKVKARITSIVTFGAFCEILDSEPLVKGLIHISEISNLFVKNIEDFLQVGDEVECEVLSFNPDKNQANLSYKNLHPQDENLSALHETNAGFKNLKKSTF